MKSFHLIRILEKGWPQRHTVYFALPLNLELPRAGAVSQLRKRMSWSRSPRHLARLNHHKKINFFIGPVVISCWVYIGTNIIIVLSNQVYGSKPIKPPETCFYRCCAPVPTEITMDAH
jgi:hypothetical protein